jgi:hypothetical protein
MYITTLTQLAKEKKVVGVELVIPKSQLAPLLSPAYLKCDVMQMSLNMAFSEWMRDRLPGSILVARYPMALENTNGFTPPCRL